MRGLTLWRPWPWTILHWPSGAATGVGPKRIENRTKPPPSGIVGGEPIALHAGKVFDWEAVPFIRDRLGAHPAAAFMTRDAAYPRTDGSEPVRMVHPEGAIQGTARVTGWIHVEKGRVIGHVGVTPERAVELARDPWFFGPFGWILDDVIPLERPLEHRGDRGLWTVKPPVAREVLAQTVGRAATCSR